MVRNPTPDEWNDYNGDVGYMRRMNVLPPVGKSTKTAVRSSLESGAEGAINVHLDMDTTCGEFCDTKLMMKYANNMCPTRLRGTRFEELLPELQKFPNQKMWVRLLEIGVDVDSTPDNPNWYEDIWHHLEVMADRKISVEAKDLEAQSQVHPVVVDGLDTVGDLKRQTGFTDYTEDGTGGVDYCHFSQRLNEAEDDETLASFCTRMGWSRDVIDMNLKSDGGYKHFERSPRVAINEGTTVGDLRVALGLDTPSERLKYDRTPLAVVEQLLRQEGNGHRDVPYVAKQLGIEVEDLIALVGTARDVVVDDEWIAHRKQQMESPDATFEVEGAMNLTCGTFLGNLGIDYARERVPEALKGTMFERAVFLIQKTPDTPLWQRLIEIWGKNTTDNIVRENWYGDLWRFLAHISDNKIRVTVLDEDRAMERHPVIVDGLNTVGDLKAQTGYQDRDNPGGMRRARWITNILGEPTVDDDETLESVLGRHHGNVTDVPNCLDPDKEYRFYPRTTRIRLENTTQVCEIERAIGIADLACEHKYADTHLEQLEQVLSMFGSTTTAQRVCLQMDIELADLATLIESVADVVFEETVEPETNAPKTLTLQWNTTVADIADALGITVNAMGGEEIKYPSGSMQALEEEVRSCIGAETADDLARLLGISFDELGELIHEHSDVQVVQMMEQTEPLSLGGGTSAGAIMEAMGMSDSGDYKYDEPDLIRLLEEILRANQTDTAAMIAGKMFLPFSRLVSLIATKIEVEGA